MSRQISYYDAVYYKGNHYILCNEIVQLDDSIFQNCDTDDDIYQFYISDCSEYDVKALKRLFSDIHFSYSEKLDLYILCVQFEGLSWRLVDVDVLDDSIIL